MIQFCLGFGSSLLLVIAACGILFYRTRTRSQADRVTRLIRFAMLYVVIITFAAVVFAGIWLTKKYIVPPNAPSGQSIGAFGATVLAETAAAAFAYLISYFGFARAYSEMETKQQLLEYVVDPIKDHIKQPGGITEYQPWNRVPWNDDIANACQIDLCVQGWDSLVHQCMDSFIIFFRKGGVLHLILPDLTSSSTKEDTMYHMRYRMKKTDVQQRAEIENTLSRLEDAKRQANNGTIVPHRVKPMLWYCLMRMDDTCAYISLYEQDRQYGTIQAPVYKVQLAKYPKTRDWITKELTHLRSFPATGLAGANQPTGNANTMAPMEKG